MRSPLSKRLTALARKVVQKAKRPKRLTWLHSLDFQTVLDVGANTGQFVEEARLFAPDAMIYSFEPLPDCFAELTKRFPSDQKFRAFNVALGDSRGETSFHQNTYAQSSSMLKMATLHKEAFPETAATHEVKVAVETLDHLQSALDLRGPVLLKIDVQGFEDRVIRGATEVLRHVDVAIVEMSVEPLYEGQTLFDGVYRMMTERGFLYRGNQIQLEHPKDGRILQVDGIFTRKQSESGTEVSVHRNSA